MFERKKTLHRPTTGRTRFAQNAAGGHKTAQNEVGVRNTQNEVGGHRDCAETGRAYTEIAQKRGGGQTILKLRPETDASQMLYRRIRQQAAFIRNVQIKVFPQACLIGKGHDTVVSVGKRLHHQVSDSAPRIPMKKDMVIPALDIQCPPLRKPAGELARQFVGKGPLFPKVVLLVSVGIRGANGQMCGDRRLQVTGGLMGVVSAG